MINIRYITSLAEKIEKEIDDVLDEEMLKHTEIFGICPDNPKELSRRFTRVCRKLTAMKLTNHIGNIKFSMRRIKNSTSGGMFCMIKNQVWFNPRHFYNYKIDEWGYSNTDVIVHELTHSMDVSLEPTGSMIQDHLCWEDQSCEILAVSATIASKILRERLDIRDLPNVTKAVLKDLDVSWEFRKRFIKLAFRILNS